MIVEDSEAMRKVMKSFVQHFADRIYECSDGSEAVSSYGSLLPDWVLMDIRMKTMDGITATRKITTQFPQARIIIVTDYGSEPLREAASNAGARDYVLKEELFKIENLIQ